MTARNYNSERTLNIPERQTPEQTIYTSAFVKCLPNEHRPYGYLKSSRFPVDAILGMDVITAYVRIADIKKGARIRVAARYDEKCRRHRVIRIDSVVPT